MGTVLLGPNTVDLNGLSPEDETPAWELLRDRADPQYSISDCTSFVRMRRFGSAAALTLYVDSPIEGFELRPRQA